MLLEIENPGYLFEFRGALVVLQLQVEDGVFQRGRVLARKFGCIRGEQERHTILAELDAVARLENMLGDPHSAQVCPESALQIENRVGAAAADNPGMTPGDMLIVDADVAIASPADNSFVACDLITAAGGFLDPADVERVLFARLCFHFRSNAYFMEFSASCSSSK